MEAREATEPGMGQAAETEHSTNEFASRVEGMPDLGSSGAVARLERFMQTASDHVEWVSAQAGLNYDHDTTLVQKATNVARAQQSFMQDVNTVLSFAGAALLVLIMSGRVFRRETRTAAKLVSLGLSMLWASQGILLFGQTCGDSMPIWPLEGFLTCLLHAAESCIICILGNSGFLVFNRPGTRIQSSFHQQMGMLLVVLSFATVALQQGTGGKFGKIGFPVDAFTVGFMFMSAHDSAYSKAVTWLPVAMMMLRSGLGVLQHEFEDAPFFLLSYGCWLLLQRWGRKRDAYEWPEQRRPFGAAAGGAAAKAKPRPPAMMKEAENGSGGVQGLSFVQQQLITDEDGDEAMEFFEATDQGLRRRNVTLH